MQRTTAGSPTSIVEKVGAQAVRPSDWRPCECRDVRHPRRLPQYQAHGLHMRRGNVIAGPVRYEDPVAGMSRLLYVCHRCSAECRVGGERDT